MVLLGGVEKEIYNVLLYLIKGTTETIYCTEETEGQIQAMC